MNDPSYGQPDDWFAANAPPPGGSIGSATGQMSDTGFASGSSDAPLRTVDPNAVATAAAQGGITGNTGGGTVDVQSLWNQYRQANPGFHPTQGSATSLQPFVDWAKSQGANINLAAPGSGGYVKGITDQNGNFTKLLDGSDNPIFLPGGDAGGGSGAGGPYSNASFDQNFSFPAWTGTFTAPTLAQAQQEPGYQFVQQQGENAILRNAAAMGIARTGGTLKDLDTFNTGLADTTYSSVYNRAASEYNNTLQSYMVNLGLSQDTYNAALQKYGVNTNNNAQAFGLNQGAQNQAFGQQYSLASLGLSATTAQAGLYAGQGANAANIYGSTAAQQGNLATQAGNATAAGQVGSANAYTSALGSIGSNLGALYAQQGRNIYQRTTNPSPYSYDYGG